MYVCMLATLHCKNCVDSDPRANALIGRSYYCTFENQKEALPLVTPGGRGLKTVKLLSRNTRKPGVTAPFSAYQSGGLLAMLPLLKVSNTIIKN